MKIMIKIKAILVVVILLGFSSCATSKLYEGPKLDGSKLAILRAEGEAVVRGFDGKIFVYGSSEYFEFLPGKHVLRVGYLIKGYGFSNQAYLVEFEAIEGHQYRLTGSHSDISSTHKKWSFLLYDETDKKEVGKIIDVVTNW